MADKKIGPWFKKEPPKFQMKVLMSTTDTPPFEATGGTLTFKNLGGNYWDVYSKNNVTQVNILTTGGATSDVKEVTLELTTTLTSTNSMFFSASGMTKMTLANTCNFSNVTDASYMFYSVGSIGNCDIIINKGDFINCTSFYQMLSYVNFNGSLDLSNLQTPKGEDFGYFLYGADNLTSLNLTNLDTSKATTLWRMFSYWRNGTNLTDLDLTNLDFSSVTSASQMFQDSSDFTSIRLPDFNTSNNVNYFEMFDNCTNLVCINKIDTTNSSDSRNMFTGCTSLTAPDATAQSDIVNQVNQPWINPNSCP